MSKIIEITTKIIVGTISGLILWAILFSLPIFLLTYESGSIPFQIGFGQVGIDNNIPIIAGLIIGLVQGLFIGIFFSFFEIETWTKGILFGIIGNKFFAFLLSLASLYFLSNQESNSVSIFDWVYYSFVFFLTFSIIFFLPSSLIGLFIAVISKLFPSEINLK